MPTLKEHFYGLSRSRMREEATKKCGDFHEIYSVNGDCFRGHWWKDKKDGLGEQRKVDGYKYHGLWSQNKRDGYGILKKKDFVLDRVDVIYEGQWCMGRPDGLGIGFLPDGTYYEGEYRKGLRSGWGTMMHSNGSQTSGQWLKDRVNGVATWWNSNGNFYTGEFKDGKFHGKGVYVMPSRGKMLQGVWMDNQFFKGISKDLEDESKREEILEE